MTYSDSSPGADPRVEELRREGHSVEVRWLRVPRSRSGQSWPLRAIQFVPAYAKAALLAMIPGRFDQVFINTSPPFAFVPAVLRSLVTGELVTLVHYDIFPDNVMVAGIGCPRALFELLSRLHNFFERRASFHETLSSSMRKTLVRKLGPEVGIEVVPLVPTPGLVSVPRSENRWSEEAGLSDYYVVMYAGNLGRMYDFTPMLEAARKLSEHPDILFVFVGRGFQEGLIREAAEKLPNVRLLPCQPSERISEVLCSGDLHVVPLRPGAIDLMWPHKLDNLRELGLKVLAVGFDLVGAPEMGEKTLEEKILFYASRNGESFANLFC